MNLFLTKKQAKYLSVVVDMANATGSLSNQHRAILIFFPGAKRT